MGLIPRRFVNTILGLIPIIPGFALKTVSNATGAATGATNPGSLFCDRAVSLCRTLGNKDRFLGQGGAQYLRYQQAVADLAASNLPLHQAQILLNQELAALHSLTTVSHKAKLFDMTKLSENQQESYLNNLARISELSAQVREQSDLPEKKMSIAELNQFEYEFSFFISTLALGPKIVEDINTISVTQIKKSLESFIEQYIKRHPLLITEDVLSDKLQTTRDTRRQELLTALHRSEVNHASAN